MIFFLIIGLFNLLHGSILLIVYWTLWMICCREFGLYHLYKFFSVRQFHCLQVLLIFSNLVSFGLGLVWFRFELGCDSVVLTPKLWGPQCLANLLYSLTSGTFTSPSTALPILSPFSTALQCRVSARPHRVLLCTHAAHLWTKGSWCVSTQTPGLRPSPEVQSPLFCALKFPITSAA